MAIAWPDMSRHDLTKLALETEGDMFRVVIETPLGSHSKYNYNPELDAFELDDTLPRGSEFPFDFGFFPSTLGEDGDPLDALVLSDRGLAVGILFQARLIGVILPPMLLDQVESFFKLDSPFKGKEVNIVGPGNRAEAKKLLSSGVKRFARAESRGRQA